MKIHKTINTYRVVVNIGKFLAIAGMDNRLPITDVDIFIYQLFIITFKDK